MPEGDTIARAADTLRRWLVGRELTAVDARDVALRHRASKLVGHTVDAVEARAKHLLITVDDQVIHSHMRMTGSWHVYERGERWRKRRDAMRLVLEAGDRVAVCFDAPVVQVVRAGDVDALPGLATLGPDVLVDIDVPVAVRRFRDLPASTPVGDALLDQTVVSGLGNIWRCEALYAQRVHLATAVGDIDDERLAALVDSGARMMGASAARTSARPRAQVYKRTGQPCRRCGTAIVARRLGRDNRTAYWCATCQVTPDTQDSDKATDK